MRRSSGSGTVKKATGKQATEAGNRKKSPKPNKKVEPERILLIDWTD